MEQEQNIMMERILKDEEHSPPGKKGHQVEGVKTSNKNMVK